MDSTNEESREAPKSAASYLKKNRPRSKQMLFVVGAINKFLDNEKITLDQAFGFKKERGKYKRADDPKHIDLVYKALQMQLKGKPWKTISGLSGCSEKEFRRLWNRYKSQAFQQMVDKAEPINFDE